MGLIFAVGLALAATAQEVKPLREADRLKLDSFSSGDALTKQPLGIDGDMPVKRAEKAPDKKAKGPTVITAVDGATFDQKTHEAVFFGQVVVNDPEFNVTCDKLTAFLKHEDPKAAGDKPKPAADPPPAAAPDKAGKNDKGGKLDHALAEGHVIITQDKVETDGTISHNVGHGEQATYDSASGDIVLIGMPQVEQGINTCIALEKTTRIILNRDGKMRVIGPHKSVIKDASSDK
jgi:lipopolysaccharide export system protein LptA